MSKEEQSAQLYSHHNLELVEKHLKRKAITQVFLAIGMAHHRKILGLDTRPRRQLLIFLLSSPLSFLYVFFDCTHLEIITVTLSNCNDVFGENICGIKNDRSTLELLNAGTSPEYPTEIETRSSTH